MADSGMEYLDLDLLIERSGRGYRARILSSPAGEVPPAPFRLPFSNLSLENFVLRMGRSGATTRGFGGGEARVAKAFGQRLFGALFREQLGTCLRSSLEVARGRSAGLRLRLRLSDSPDLANVPWEYLYDPSEDRFLVLSDRTPIVRYLELPRPAQRLSVEPPLRILVMIASPRGVPQLDVEKEWSLMGRAVAGLAAAGRVRVDLLPGSSMAALQRHLRRGDYHVFHFIGHGAFDEREAAGTLVLEGGDRDAALVDSAHLATVLCDQPALRLVVLNACEGARTDRRDPFAGLAQRLVQQGVSAVIAMQFEITDRAAIAFTEVFYEALADSYPVDGAVAEGRKAILNATSGAEWGTPVLYMRSPDGRLFQVGAPLPAAPLEGGTANGGRAAPAEAAPAVPEPAPAVPPARREAPGRPAGRPAARRGLAARVRGALTRRRAVVAASALAFLVAAGLLGWVALARPTGVEGWTRIGDMPTSLEAAAVDHFEGRVWVVGGVSPNEGRPKLDMVQVYDPQARRWFLGPRLPVALSHAALVSTGKQLFVIGGLSDRGSESAVYHLDTSTGTWRPDRPLPAPRGAGAAVWDGNHVLFGGGVGPDHRAAAEVWALESDGWNLVGRLQQPREKLTAASDGFGTAWFLAGRDLGPPSSIYGLVDVVQASSVHPSGRVTPLEAPAAVWWPGAGVCVVGGHRADGFSAAVECLDQQGGSRHLPPLSVPRAGLGVTVLDGTVYAIGGYDAGHHGTTLSEALRASA